MKLLRKMRFALLVPILYKYLVWMYTLPITLLCLYVFNSNSKVFTDSTMLGSVIFVVVVSSVFLYLVVFEIFDILYPIVNGLVRFFQIKYTERFSGSSSTSHFLGGTHYETRELNIVRADGTTKNEYYKYLFPHFFEGAFMEPHTKVMRRVLILYLGS